MSSQWAKTAMTSFYSVYYFNLIILITSLLLLRCGHCRGEDGDSDMQTGMTPEVTNICARNRACRYAICLWWNRTGNFCNLMPFLMNSNCVCPPAQVCSLTSEMAEDGTPLSYHYRCRNPWRSSSTP